MHTLIIYKENLNMANGTLKILPDSQKTYCKYAYTYGDTTYSDIHTFTTSGRTSQFYCACHFDIEGIAFRT